jgi:hypothetical protein
MPCGLSHGLAITNYPKKVKSREVDVTFQETEKWEFAELLAWIPPNRSVLAFDSARFASSSTILFAVP